jgi:hypothetical protein
MKILIVSSFMSYGSSLMMPIKTQMRYETLIFGGLRVENLVASSKKDIQGEKRSRLGISLDAPTNAPNPGSKLIMLTLIGSKSGRIDD